MPKSPRLIYWDSCVFLHYIESTPTWVPILDAIIDEVKNDSNLMLITSTVTIVEVSYIESEKASRALSASVEISLDAMWRDTSILQLVECDEAIARRARSLLRRAVAESRQLKPMDAVHLATADVMRVHDCHTTDTGMLKWNDLGFPIQQPWARKPLLPGIPPAAGS